MLLTKRNHTPSGFNGLMDSLFDDSFSMLPGFGKTWNHAPAVNIEEDDKRFTLSVEAPGFEKDDFNVEFEGKHLTISAEQKKETEEKQVKFTRREFSTRSFSRSFVVNEKSVDTEAIQASYTNGILKIELPKREAEAEKAAKRISIQ